MTKLLRGLKVIPGKTPRLGTRKTDNLLGLDSRDDARPLLADSISAMQKLQGRLGAEGERSVLLVIQGMDASGKDGLIRQVFTGVNPQGCSVWSFKAPTSDDYAHDYLRRVSMQLPRRGNIGIFNRSHYEDLVTARVIDVIDDDRLEKRIGHVRNFEKMLNDEGTKVVKVFLHISKDEQLKRLKTRVDKPEKHWKFEPSDLVARKSWDEYERWYEHVMKATSTEWAPWYVIPSDNKWVRDAAVADLLVDTLFEMDPQPPTLEIDPQSIEFEEVLEVN